MTRHTAYLVGATAHHPAWRRGSGPAAALLVLAVGLGLCAPTRADALKPKDVTLKVRVQLPCMIGIFTNPGGKGQPDSAILGGNVALELFRWGAIELGSMWGWGGFLIANQDYDVVVRAGIMPTVYDTRTAPAEAGWQLQAGALAGYRYWHFARNWGDGHEGLERNHQLVIDGVFEATYWWSRHFGLALRGRLEPFFTVDHTTEGYWGYDEALPNSAWGLAAAIEIGLAF